MGLVPKEYVTLNQGAYRIAGTRVSLDSLVYLFRGHVGGKHGRKLPSLDARAGAWSARILSGKPKGNRPIPCRRSARRGGSTPAVQANECRTEIAKLQRARSASQIPG